MPQRRIEFDGIIHTFPDDATDDEIAAALGEQSSSSELTPTPDATKGVIRRVAEGAWNAINPVKTLEGLVSMAKNPGASLRGIGEQFKEASNDPRARLLGNGGVIARMALDDAYDRMDSGDIAGAAGSGLTTLATMGLPAAAAKVVPGLQRVAGRTWRGAAGAGTPEAAERVLSRGRGVLNLKNADALREEARAGTTAAQPAREASMVLAPDGRPAIPATPEVPMQFSELYGGGKDSAVRAARRGVTQTRLGRSGTSLTDIVTKKVLGPKTQSRVAQYGYNVATDSPNLMREAVLANLLGQSVANAPEGIAPVASHPPAQPQGFRASRADLEAQAARIAAELRKPNLDPDARAMFLAQAEELQRMLSEAPLGR